MKRTIHTIAFAMMVSTCLVNGAQAEEKGSFEPYFLLIQAGKYDEARKLLSENGATIIDAFFLEGEIALAEGRYQDAVNIYRDLAKIAPDNTLIRLRLIAALANNKEHIAARYELTKSNFQSLSDVELEAFQNVARTLSNTEPYGIEFDFGLNVSENINNADEETQGQIFGFTYQKPEELTPQAGAKIYLNPSMFYRKALNERNSLQWDLSLEQNYYTVDTQDYGSLTLSMTWRNAGQNHLYSITPYVTNSWGDDEQYTTVIDNFGSLFNPNDDAGVAAEIVKINENRTTFGLSTSLYWKIQDQHHLTVSTNYSQTDWASGSFKTYADNDFYAASVNYNYELNNKTAYGITIGAAQYLTDRDLDENVRHNDYIKPNINLNLSHKFENNISTNFSIGWDEQRYGADYPFFDYARIDETYSISASAKFENISALGFYPQVSCTWFDTKSNIEGLDQSGSNCGFAFERRF